MGTGPRAGGVRAWYASTVPGAMQREAYDDAGVDRSLVRELLAMTHAERAQRHDEILADVERLAEAGRAARRGDE